jgi:hypothetical protein
LIVLVAMGRHTNGTDIVRIVIVVVVVIVVVIVIPFLAKDWQRHHHVRLYGGLFCRVVVYLRQATQKRPRGNATKIDETTHQCGIAATQLDVLFSLFRLYSTGTCIVVVVFLADKGSTCSELSLVMMMIMRRRSIRCFCLESFHNNILIVSSSSTMTSTQHVVVQQQQQSRWDSKCCVRMARIMMTMGKNGMVQHSTQKWG